MKENLEVCTARLLRHEGGYSNHPSDPGGPTNWGITLADARRYWKPGATAADVKVMPRAIAVGIYDAKYWDAQRCDELHSGVEDSLYDYGVNSGIGRSGKVLRRLLGLPDNTSVVSAEVVAAARKRDPKVLINAINDERMRFLKALRTWPTFGKGWGRRVTEVRAFDLKLAAKPMSAPVDATVTSAPVAKGMVPPPTAEKNAVAVGGGGGAAAGGGTFMDWVFAHPWQSGTIAGGIVVAIVVAFRLLDARNKRQQEAPTPGTEVVPEMKEG